MKKKEVRKNKSELQLAYEMVIKDLKKQTKCKNYCFSCFDCGLKRLVEDLESFYDLMKDDFESK